jgi:hypothetical protein
MINTQEGKRFTAPSYIRDLRCDRGLVGHGRELVVQRPKRQPTTRMRLERLTLVEETDRITRRLLPGAGR